MSLSSNVSFDIASAAICAALILIRCAYRLLFRCHVHTTCHRRWRIDDAYMAFALLPLIARTATISTSFILNPSHSQSPGIEDEALAQGVSLDQLNADRELSRKLLIPGRISYALFLWSLKLTLLAFYSRFVGPLNWGKQVIRGLWWFMLSSFLAVFLATMLECRPLSLSWQLAPEGERATCSRGLVNLLTMAIFNILTDLALIILPFPMLRNVRLDKKAKFQLAVLFGIGGVVVVITILRIPLILISSVSQRSRSMWASIEILCACIVANTAFFYTLTRDFQRRGKDHGHSSNHQPPGGNFYLQSLPSSSNCPEPMEPPKIVSARTEEVVST